MPLFLVLWLSSVLLCGPTDAAIRGRRQQPVKISSSNGTETNSPYKDWKSTPPSFPSFQPPGLNSQDNKARDTACDFDFCLLGVMCGNGETCITSPATNCTSQCVQIGSNKTSTTPTPKAVPTVDNTSLRPYGERPCAGFDGLRCLHGKPRDCNKNAFSCVCDPGWVGSNCEENCNLSCVHGGCGIDHITREMFCSCWDKYAGRLCDELIPDPKERARILAAILSSALAVAVILIIIIPIIMWRLRVILILKLIYIFKEYEDEDGKEIDAYISMTSTPNAEEFVYGTLQPILEKHNFKLFLQARDAPAGEVLSETILSALEKSRRTIMIITPDYIRSEWNRFEYLIAQHETLKLRQRIIPIILEDVEKEDVNMDKSLKHILNSVKCLKYPQEKPKTIPEDVQSPDINRSTNSTTHFSKIERSNITGSVLKVDQKFERKVEKFRKRLILTMPKKKTENSGPRVLAILTQAGKYEVNASNCKEISRNMECNKHNISEFVSKIHFLEDINNSEVCTQSGNPCKTKNISEIQNDRLISMIA